MQRRSLLEIESGDVWVLSQSKLSVCLPLVEWRCRTHVPWFYHIGVNRRVCRSRVSGYNRFTHKKGAGASLRPRVDPTKAQLRLAGGRRKLGRNGISSDRPRECVDPPEYLRDLRDLHCSQQRLPWLATDRTHPSACSSSCTTAIQHRGIQTRSTLPGIHSILSPPLRLQPTARHRLRQRIWAMQLNRLTHSTRRIAHSRLRLQH